MVTSYSNEISRKQIESRDSDEKSNLFQWRINGFPVLILRMIS